MTGWVGLAGRVACGVSLVAVAAGAAASQTPPLAKPRTLMTIRDHIGALAQSNHRLAWLRGPDTCPKAEIFDLRTRRAVRVNPGCPKLFGAFGSLAFDGNRLLWQHAYGLQYYAGVGVLTAALNDRRTRTVAWSPYALDIEGPYRGTYESRAPFPMAGGRDGLLFYKWGSGKAAIFSVAGRRARKLFAEGHVLGLSLAGRRLAVVEDRPACCNFTPVWSPDGTKLAWHHVQGRDISDGELVVANADGSSLRVLGTHVISSPSWSPDGSQLVVSDTGLIKVVNADGTGARPLANGFAPRWSPDGSRIAFLRNNNDLYRINADGSNEARLTSDLPTWSPQWSPDGTKLLVSRAAGSDPARAWIVDADHGAATVLPPAHADWPTWSPDGTRIAFAMDGQVAVMNADGTGAHALTGDVIAQGLAWSSDGAKIAYSDSDGESQAVFVINADGTANHQVSENYTSGADPDWAPGRQTLAWGDAASTTDPLAAGVFTANEDGTGRVKIAGYEDSLIGIRNSRTGVIVRSFVAPASVLSVAMSTEVVAVLSWKGSGPRFELRRYRPDGRLLGITVLPRAVDPASLAASGNTILYDTPGRIFALTAETGKTRVLATPAARPVGLSVVARRSVWAENLGRKRARIRAIDLTR